MNTIKFLSVIALSSLAVACSKDKDNAINDPSFSSSSFSEISVAKDFDWSSSIKGNLTVVLDAPTGLYTEKQPIELQDADGNVLQSSIINGGQASFDIAIPEVYTELYAYYPNTQDKVQINAEKKSTILKIEAIDFAEGFKSSYYKSGISSKKSTASNNLLSDGDFESLSAGTDTRTITKVRPTGSWFRYNSAAHIALQGNTNVFTSKVVGEDGIIIQSIKVSGDQIYDLNYEHSGNAGFFILFMDKDEKYIGHTRVTLSSNGIASCRFLAAFNVRHIQLYGFSSTNDYIDNVDLSLVPEVDTDGDGVVDRKDYYPNDPTRAYASYYPTIGRQIIAFEDLWPYNGDYDFNDVVLSSYTEISRDKDLNIVSAKVSVIVNAAGMGVPNGIAMRFLDNNKQAFPSNLISSFTLAQDNSASYLDPDVQNGVVVSENLGTDLKPYYSNTRSNLVGDPQEFTFTVNFTQGTGNISLQPEFYIFRTETRSHEIHLPGYSGTEIANTALYNTGHDLNGTYKNAKGLPWALEVIYPYTLYFNHPLEKVDLVAAYTQFQLWASSNGISNKKWMLYPTQGKVFIP